MNNKKKIVLILSILLVSILLIVGVTYAALSYEKEGETQELIVGDIWMKYEETNQLVLEDAMPTSIDGYFVNPIMKTQEVIDNELTRCIDIYTDWYYDFESKAESFCRGTGTANGLTIQEDLESWLSWAESESTIEEEFLNAGGQELLDAGVVIPDGDTYKVNPVMATQEVNELTRCVSIYTNMQYEFDEGSDAEIFCRGTGTAYGLTIQEDLEEWYYHNEYFLRDGGQGLLDEEIIISKIKKMPYFEFKISGKNTYTKKDIWYEILLNHGEEHATRTTRIRDDLLRFSLVEVNGNEEVFLINNRNYNDLTNKKIWVDTIDKDTKNEINKTYRLYMWIDYNTVIGNIDEDYTLEEWNDVYASIKVNVSGDFNEKKLEPTDESCFEIEELITYTHNSNMTNEEINKCITILHEWNFGLSEGEDWESYCKGTGTKYGDTFQEDIDNNSYGPDVLNNLKENNIIISNGVDGVKIIDYDETCEKNLVIPKTINGYKTLIIGESAFSRKELTSVIIPDTIVSIEYGAFFRNDLSTVVFEKNSNLKTIIERAFYNNNVFSVVIPNSVTYLDCNAFDESVEIYKHEELICEVTPG